ncbi:J domain-containing protein [Massilia sp. YIM B04103]|uniref:J domain-containing protein n=1 Tax=Massilia sp. YIM B04103 TaxID=2963106 RepID=UPI00210974AB|nr:J domain-containing protein [Massilia sp. YIM B04103]
MGKIHTHYDNLKVARGAPQEVIRAAYKALSQKYHPDKNPGDDKAARIMAIVNSAYGTLADPQRRKEHDAWIVQEEWEIEWLESTRHEERSPAEHNQAWPGHVKPRRRVLALLRSWRWWTTVGVSVAVGWVAGALSVSQPRQVPAMLAGAWGGGTAASANAAAAGALTATVAARPHHGSGRGEAQGELGEVWAEAKPAALEAAAAHTPPIKVLAVSQVVLPGGGAECEGEATTLAAPNGEPWPAHSGYVEGFPVGNKGDAMQLTLDNSANPSAAFIKVYDMERRSNVRYAYVQAHDKLLVDKLSNGKYEIRYQNVELGAGKGGCASRPASAALR